MKHQRHLQQAESLLRNAMQFGGPMRHKHERHRDHPYQRLRHRPSMHSVRVYYGCDNTVLRRGPNSDMPPRPGAQVKIDVSFTIVGIVNVRGYEYVQVRIERMREYHPDGTAKRVDIPEVGKLLNIWYYTTDRTEIAFKRRVSVLDSVNDHDDEYLYEDEYMDERQWYLDVQFSQFLRYAKNVQLTNDLNDVNDQSGRLRI